MSTSIMKPSFSESLKKSCSCSVLRGAHQLLVRLTFTGRKCLISRTQLDSWHILGFRKRTWKDWITDYKVSEDAKSFLLVSDPFSVFSHFSLPPFDSFCLNGKNVLFLSLSASAHSGATGWTVSEVFMLLLKGTLESCSVIVPQTVSTVLCKTEEIISTQTFKMQYLNNFKIRNSFVFYFSSYVGDF